MDELGGEELDEQSISYVYMCCIETVVSDKVSCPDFSAAGEASHISASVSVL